MIPQCVHAQESTESGLWKEIQHGLFLLFSEWTGADEDQEDIHVWEDNWDDDNVEDDFCNQLRYNLVWKNMQC